MGRALGASGDYKGLRASIMARTEKILSTAETKRLMQDYSQYLNEYMPHAFQPYFPDDVGYATALHHVITNLLIPDPLVKAWMKGREALPEMVSGVGGELDETAKLANSRRALEEFVRSSDDPKVKEWLKRAGWRHRRGSPPGGPATAGIASRPACSRTRPSARWSTRARPTSRMSPRW